MILTAILSPTKTSGFRKLQVQALKVSSTEQISDRHETLMLVSYSRGMLHARVSRDVVYPIDVVQIGALRACKDKSVRSGLLFGDQKTKVTHFNLKFPT